MKCVGVIIEVEEQSGGLRLMREWRVEVELSKEEVEEVLGGREGRK